MSGLFEQELFQRRVDEFAEAFWLDAQTGGTDSVDELHAVCAQDGLPDDYIRRARKAGAISVYSGEVKAL